MADRKIIYGCAGCAVVGLIGGVGTIVLGALGLFGLSMMKGGDVGDVAALLPSDTPVFVAGRGFADLAIEFGPAIKEAAGGSDSSELSAQCIQQVGFDCTTADGWASTGLDFTRPWGFAMVGAADPDDADLLTLIPLDDEDEALPLIRAALDKNGVPVEDQALGDDTVSVVAGMAAYTVTDDYLVVFASGRSGFDPVASARTYLARDTGNSLDGSDDFNGIVDAVGSDWHLFTYVSATVLAEGMADAAQSMGQLAEKWGAHGGGGALTISNSELHSRIVIANEADPVFDQVASFQGKDKLGSKISGTPVFAVRMSTDLEAAWAQAQNNPDVADSKAAMAQLRDQWGVDVEADVIKNLDGNFTLAFVLPTGSTQNLDTLLYMGVKDSSRATSLVDAVSGKLREAGLGISSEKADGETWAFVDKAGGVGVAQDHMIAAMGDGTIKRTRDSLSSGSGSYLDGLPSDVKSDFESGPPLVGYLDFARLATAADAAVKSNPLLGGMAGSTSSMQGMATITKGLSFKAEMTGTIGSFDTTLYASDEGFVKGISDAGSDVQDAFNQVQRAMR